ncbi:MAG: tyrosine-type recombinase/integrase [Steroidobacteraceae bacterium]
MPKFRRHKASDGSLGYTATVRVAGISSVSQTFPTPRAAADWFKAKQAELRGLRKTQRNAVRADLPGLTISSLILKYLDDPDVQGLKTFDEVHRLGCEWIQLVGAVKVLDAGVLTWREGRDRLGRGRGPATTNRYVSAMRGCWNWGRAAGLVPPDRIWPDKMMGREPAGRQRYLTNDELARLQEAARKHSDVMYTAVMVSVAAGMRLGELLRIDWTDIDLARQMLAIRITKTGVPRRTLTTAAI